MLQAEALGGGFADTPIAAAQAFRAALNAMAQPGRIEAVAGAAPPAPMSVAAGVLVLTLCDQTTPLCLAGDHDCKAVRDWVTFHTGAPLVGKTSCAFALGDWAALTPLEGYALGSAEYPDRSASLIVEVKTLVAEGHSLTGPGIKDAAHLNLPDARSFQLNAAMFPQGLDFFFACGNRLAALPRTTKVGG